jgi:putative hemolysin
MLIIIFILLLILSAVFSGSETAFLTHQKAKSMVWFRKRKKNSKKLYYYLRNPDQFLIIILVGNNLINTAYSTVGTLIFINFFTENIVVIILAILILIFGEIFPKIYFNQNSDNSILMITKVISIAEFILKPLIIISTFVTNLFIKNSKKTDHVTQELFTVHDIDTILEESKGKGHFAQLKHDYITKVLSLNETRIKEIMIPRVDMVAIDVDETVEHLYEQFSDGGHSKVPIFEKSHDNVIGIIFIFDLLKFKYKTIRDYIKPVMMVPDTKRAIDLLIDFRKENKSVAIAIDEYGGTAGLVTIESLLEVLIGEFDIDFNKSRKLERIIELGENRFRISGRVKIDDLIERGIALPEGNYETIAGLILDVLGRFPSKNEGVQFGDYEIKPVYITKKRIVWVELAKTIN